MSRSNSDSEDGGTKLKGWALVNNKGDIENGSESDSATSSQSSSGYIKVSPDEVSFHKSQPVTPAEPASDEEPPSDINQGHESSLDDLTGQQQDLIGPLEQPAMLKLDVNLEPIVNDDPESPGPLQGPKEAPGTSSYDSFEAVAGNSPTVSGTYSTSVLEASEPSSVDSDVICSSPHTQEEKIEVEQSSEENKPMETDGSVTVATGKASLTENSGTKLAETLKSIIMEREKDNLVNTDSEGSDFVRLDEFEFPDINDTNPSQESKMAASSSSNSSVFSNFNFLRRSRSRSSGSGSSNSREEDNESEPAEDEVDDRVESDISGVDIPDDDPEFIDEDLSHKSYDIADLWDGVANENARRRNLHHSPNSSLNYRLNCLAICAVFFAVGIGFGHFIGSSYDFYENQAFHKGQVRKMQSLQDDYMICMNQRDSTIEKLMTLSKVYNTTEEAHKQTILNLETELGELQTKLKGTQNQLPVVSSKEDEFRRRIFTLKSKLHDVNIETASRESECKRKVLQLEEKLQNVYATSEEDHKQTVLNLEAELVELQTKLQDNQNQVSVESSKEDELRRRIFSLKSKLHDVNIETASKENEYKQTILLLEEKLNNVQANHIDLEQAKQLATENLEKQLLNRAEEIHLLQARILEQQQQIDDAMVDQARLAEHGDDMDTTKQENELYATVEKESELREVKTQLNNIMTENDDLRKMVVKMRYLKHPGNSESGSHVDDITKQQMNELQLENSDLKVAVGKMRYTQPSQNDNQDKTSSNLELEELKQSLKVQENRANMFERLYTKERENSQQSEPTPQDFFTCMRLILPNINTMNKGFDEKFKDFVNKFWDHWGFFKNETEYTFEEKWKLFKNLSETDEFKEVMDNAAHMYEGINESARQSWEYVQNYTRSEMFQEHINNTKSAFEKIQENLQTHWEAVKNYTNSEEFQQRVNSTKSTFQTIQENLKSKWDSVKNYTKSDKVQNILNKTTGTVKNLTDSLHDTWKQVKSSPTISSLSDSISEKITKLRAKVNSKWERVKKKIQRGGKQWYSEPAKDNDDQEITPPKAPMDKDYWYRLRKLQRSIRRMNEESLRRMDDDDMDDILDEFEDFHDDYEDEVDNDLEEWLLCQAQWWKYQLSKQHAQFKWQPQCLAVLPQWQRNTICQRRCYNRSDKCSCKGKKAKRFQYKHKEKLGGCCEKDHKQNKKCFKECRKEMKNIPKPKKSEELKYEFNDEHGYATNENYTDDARWYFNLMADRARERGDTNSQWYFERMQERANLREAPGMWYLKQLQQAKEAIADDDDDDDDDDDEDASPDWLFERALDREYELHKTDWIFERARDREDKHSAPTDWYTEQETYSEDQPLYL